MNSLGGKFAHTVGKGRSNYEFTCPSEKQGYSIRLGLDKGLSTGEGISRLLPGGFAHHGKGPKGYHYGK